MLYRLSFTISLLLTFSAFCEESDSFLSVKALVESVQPASSSEARLELDLTQFHEEEACQDNESKAKSSGPSNKALALTTLAAAPVAYLMTNALHETSHCLMAEAVGYDCIDLRLIPYRHEKNNFFYLASAEHRIPIELYNSPGRDVLVSAAPMFVNGAMIGLYSTLAFTDKLPENKWAKAATLLFGGMQVVDVATQLSSTKPASDSGKVMQYLKSEKGMSDSAALWTVKGAQAGLFTLGTAAVILEGKRLFLDSSKKDKKSEGVAVVPQVSGSSAGVSVRGEF